MPVDGFGLWAKTYERDSQDVLSMQSDLAQAIVGEIQVRLAPQEQQHLASARTINPYAYNAAAVTPSFRLGNQPIRNFPLVVAQVSRSMTHMVVDATTGACATFDRAVTADRFGQH